MAVEPHLCHIPSCERQQEATDYLGEERGQEGRRCSGMSGCGLISASLKMSRCACKKVNCTYGWSCVVQLSKLISNPLGNCLFVTSIGVKYEKQFLQTPYGNFDQKLQSGWLCSVLD